MQPPGDQRDEREDADPGMTGGAGDGDHETEQQLALTDDDEQLPWLESEDDDAEEAFDYRLIGYVLIGLLAFAAILLAIYSLARGGSDADLVADGSTIEAPDEPYKTRPEDPGGTRVAGTGDLSFEVAEGASRDSRLAEASEVRAPDIDREQAGEGEAAGPGVGVQIGAFSSREAASDGWLQLSRRFEALQGVRHRILEGSADSGTIYRLQAVAGDAAAADGLCRSIKNSGGDCQVKN